MSVWQCSGLQRCWRSKMFVGRQASQALIERVCRQQS